MFENKNLKAVTFSFDDGNVDDIRLISILNKYGLKGTFNLNSGKLTEASVWNFGEKEVRHINFLDSKDIYSGHEVACHTYTHPDLTKQDSETVYNETALDMKLLSFLFGYEVNGMAYPFGTFNDGIIEILKKCGILYSRTVNSTYSFECPENPYIWNPTCHFKDEKIFELADKFVNSKPDAPKIFYIWGHSYELVSEDDWKRFEDFCKKISGICDISYITNKEIIESI